MHRASGSNKTIQNLLLRRYKISRLSLVMVVASLLAIYLLLPQINQLRGSIAVLAHANVWWVGAALIMSAVSFFVAAFTQYVAGDYAGSFKKITILQLTGAFINHFLPFNMGSAGFTAQYYRKLGKTRTRAVTLSAMPLTFGAITNIAVICVVSPLTIRHVVQHTVGNWFYAWAAASVFVLLGISLLIPSLRRRLAVIMGETFDSFRSLKVYSQLPGLILGSLGLSIVFALALLCSVYATHASISAIDAFTIFVTLSVVQNAAPTPGGLGASEAFLAFGLTSVGLGLAQAVAATLIFRLVCFWAPIIPGILAVREASRWGLFDAHMSRQAKQH